MLNRVEQLRSLARDKRQKENAQSLIQAMTMRKNQQMAITDEAFDELDALMRHMHYEQS